MSTPSKADDLPAAQPRPGASGVESTSAGDGWPDTSPRESRDLTPVSRVPSGLVIDSALDDPRDPTPVTEAISDTLPPGDLAVELPGLAAEATHPGLAAEKTYPGERRPSEQSQRAAAALAKISGNVQVSDPYIDTVLDGRYHILRRIGEGGMGVVYLANHVNLERNVAVKILSDDFARKADLVRRFIQEARAAVSIKHENIVEVYDFGETESGSVYFAMEYLEGHDLAQLLRAEPNLPGARVRHIARQICRALGAAHGKQIVHRDLKPENIFLIRREDREDFVKVLDFGIAKISTMNNEGQGKHTRTGMIFGTPEYMSPEQARGEVPDHRVDIYAMGCILYEMLTGSVPFQADTFMGVLTKHMFEVVIPPSRRARWPIEPELEAICLRAMEKDRERRFQTMGDMAAALSGDVSMMYSSGAVLTPMGPDSARSIPVMAAGGPGTGTPPTSGVAQPLMLMGSAPIAGMALPGAPGDPSLAAPVAYAPTLPGVMSAQPMLPARADATAQSPLPPVKEAPRRRAWAIGGGVVAGLTILGALLHYGPKDASQPTGTTAQKVGTQPTVPEPGRPDVKAQPAVKPLGPAYLDLKGTKGASVYLDGKLLGVLPLSGLEIPVSSAALVRLQISKTGYASGALDVDLSPGAKVAKSIELTRLHGSKSDDDKPDKPEKREPTLKGPAVDPGAGATMKLKDPFAPQGR